MILISRKNQTIFYAIIIVFGIFFFYFFYKQASFSLDSISNVDLSNIDTGTVNLSGDNGQINLGILKTDKFSNLRSDSLPATHFLEGKRNPFQP
jgi:hypothetical protein